MLRTGKSLGLTLVAIAAHLHAQPGDDDVERSIRAETHDKYLVILCREPKFGSAKRAAENISALSGVQFSMNGRVWDPNRGLILPDVCDDPVYCGEYLPRRYNELHVITNPVGYISIEKSEAYPALQAGYYIALAAICTSNKQAEQELLKFKPLAPKAYIAKTQIYTGCIH